MARKRNAVTKRLITLNPNKRLRGWLPPAPGWNTRRCILELAAAGAWFTTTALRKAGLNPRTVPYALRELLRAGHLERKAIEGRPASTQWQFCEPVAPGPRPGMTVRRPRALWAYRVTESGLAHLEDLRAGKRDIIGRARSVYYAELAEWMPGRGPMRRRLVLARLGHPGWCVLDWCRWNYGNPWPIGGGLWVWREWTVEELFS